MSGLGGHIKHLYEDYSLTFSDLKNIINLLSSGKIPYTEKTDGMNMFLSFNPMLQKSMLARNKEDLEAGGVDLHTMIKRYENNPNIQKGISDLIKHFEEVMLSQDGMQIASSFGPKTFYNVELHHPSLRNVIPYDKQGILFHKTGGIHGSEFGFLQNLINNIDVNPFISFDKEKQLSFPVENHLKSLDKFMTDNTLKDHNAIGDYLIDKLLTKINELPITNDLRKKELVKKMIGVKGTNINNIITGLSHNEAEEVKKFAGNQKTIIREILYKLENIINTIALEALNNIKSDYISDSKNAIQQITFNLAQQIKHLDTAEDEELLNNYLYHKEKLKPITSPVEGIVFSYKDKPYKLTGNFAPINQIKNLSEKLNNQRKENKAHKQSQQVGIFAGSFRPPHAGHMQVIEEMSKRFDVVEILVSNPQDKQRSSMKAESAKEILETYLKAYQMEDKCKVSISSQASPIKDAYGFAGSRRFYPKAYISFITSDKDKNRYEQSIMESLPSRNRTISSVKEVVIPSLKINEIPMSAKMIREMFLDEFISEDQRIVRAFTHMPKKLSQEEKQKVYELMKKDLVQEMSGMSGGAVSGYPAPLGREDRNESVSFSGIVMSDSNPFKKKHIDEVYDYLLKKTRK